MRLALDKPAAVEEAAQAKKGMNALGEILLFAFLFLVTTLGEAILIIPFMLPELLANRELAITQVEGGLEISVDFDNLMSLIENSDTVIIAGLFTTLSMILIPLLFCKLIQKRSMRTLGFVKKNSGKEYLKGLAFGFVMFSAAVHICFLTGALQFNGFSETLAVGTFLLFVAGFLIQGMAEEVLLRGYFMVSFARRHAMWTAVVVNSVAFAALHLLNDGISVLAIVNLTLFGIFASLYFVKSGSIWGVAAFHSVWNLVQGNLYGIQVSGIETSTSVLSSTLTESMNLINGGSFGLEGGLAVTIVLVIGILLLFVFYPAARNKTPDAASGAARSKTSKARSAEWQMPEI